MSQIREELWAQVVVWSDEFDVEYSAFLMSDGRFRFFEWWEKVISCMTLYDVEAYLNIPELSGVSNNKIAQKLTSIAEDHREKLLAVNSKGVELIRAKTERAAG